MAELYILPSISCKHLPILFIIADDSAARSKAQFLEIYSIWWEISHHLVGIIFKDKPSGIYLEPISLAVLTLPWDPFASRDKQSLTSLLAISSEGLFFGWMYQ